VPPERDKLAGVATAKKKASEDEGESEVVEVAGREFTVTNVNKVFFEERGETKLDLVRYYLAVGDGVMGAMRNRPTMLQRFPHGATGESFYQKRVPKNAPDWLQTTIVATPNGTTSEALVIADLAHVVWAVNLGCLGFHPWPFTVEDEAHSDELRIDLDPQPGTDFTQIREAGHELHALLEEQGLTAYPKTTGNRGLHVYVRLERRWDSYDVRRAAVAVARELERRRPDLLTWAWWKEERGERIFVDYNQNAPHKTVFGAWSARSRAGGQVSTPLRWDELDDVHPDDLTIPVVRQRLDTIGDPWLPMYDERQSLEPLLELHERDKANGLHDAPWPPVYPKQPDEPPRVAPSRAKKDKP
jgi:DNA ligase D